MGQAFSCHWRNVVLKETKISSFMKLKFYSERTEKGVEVPSGGGVL